MLGEEAAQRVRDNGDAICTTLLFVSAWMCSSASAVDRWSRQPVMLCHSDPEPTGHQPPSRDAPVVWSVRGSGAQYMLPDGGKLACFLFLFKKF